MAVASVEFWGTRHNASDNNTNWGHWGGSGGAPAAEAPIAYQNSLAVNKLSNNSSYEGLDYDPGGTPIDQTDGDHNLWFVKVYVTDAFDLEAADGLQVGIGTTLTDMHVYTLAGTDQNGNTAFFDQYPAQGGYILTGINVSNTTWPDATDSVNAPPTFSDIDWFGARARFVNGDAKAENLALDAIDMGLGLSLVGGDGGDTDAHMSDFIAADQDSPANRWGVVKESAGTIVCVGRLIVGRDWNGGTPAVTHTDFTDNESIVIFPDGFVEEGDLGLEFDISDVDSVMVWGGTAISQGALSGGNDTRADLEVIDDGTPGTLSLTGTITNFRDVTLTDQVTVTGATIETANLTQAGADVEGGTVVLTDAAASTATVADATFNTTSLINNATFTQGSGGLGHALEVDGTETFTNIEFNGYGGTPGSNLVAASGATDAAILNDTGGAITISISGGDSPSVRNGAGATTTVQNTQAVTVNVKDARDISNLQNVRVLVTAATGGDLPFEDSVSITHTGGTATVSFTSHGFANGDLMMIEGAAEDEYNIIGTVANATANDFEYSVDSGASSPATGSPVCTAVIINELTTAGGVADNTAFVYTSDQPIAGRARLSTTTPFFKTGAITGTIESTGFTTTILLGINE